MTNGDVEHGTIGLSPHDWLPVLTQLTESGTPCVLLTIMEAKGSTPREAGVKMVVTETAQYGTIGGGNLEFEAIAAARELLKEKSAPQVRDYPLGPRLAQCCGGAVSVFLEPFLPTGKLLYLFGAGHVGREVVQVLSGLGLRVKWIDPRAAEFPNAAPKGVEKIITDAPVTELRNIPAGSFIAVMTHSHDLDFNLVSAAFKAGNFGYLGLIGSATKRVKFEKRLQAEGVTIEQLAQLRCPIGLGGTGKHPREIAIAIAAELLSLGVNR